MSVMDEDMTKVKTTLWGAFGTNGLNSDVKRHGKQIEVLFERDETLRRDIDEKLSSIYRLLFTLMIAVVTGSIGIIGALLATQL